MPAVTRKKAGATGQPVLGPHPGKPYKPRLTRKEGELPDGWVEIQVGPTRRRRNFRYHKDVLFPHSHYLNACFGWLGPEWKETADRKDIANAADLFDPYEGRPTAEAFDMINVWKLADYLTMPEQQNFIMTKLYDTFEQASGRVYKIIELVLPCYEDKFDGSPLRKFITTLFALGVADFDQRPLDQGGQKPIEEVKNHKFLHDVFRERNKLLQQYGAQPLSAPPNTFESPKSVPQNDFLVMPIQQRH